MRTEFKLKNIGGDIYVDYEKNNGEIDTDHLQGRDGSLSRLSAYVLADGRRLSATANPNVFVIVETGAVLTRL